MGCLLKSKSNKFNDAEDNEGKSNFQSDLCLETEKSHSEHLVPMIKKEIGKNTTWRYFLRC